MDGLTAGEKRVYELLTTTSLGIKEIAVRLNLATYTICSHRVRICQKLDVHSRVELILQRWHTPYLASLEKAS